MAVIVRNKQTEDRYVLLGTGYGSYKALKPNWFFGKNSSGHLNWFPADLYWFRPN